MKLQCLTEHHCLDFDGQNLQQPAAKLGLAWTLVSNWLPNRVLRYSPLLRWWQRLVLARVLASWDIVDIVDDIKSMSRCFDFLSIVKVPRLFVTAAHLEAKAVVL
ncbi:hypothetical protein CsSME_00017633 [Camellia sinensis var. sinensis]